MKIKIVLILTGFHQKVESVSQHDIQFEQIAMFTATGKWAGIRLLMLPYNDLAADCLYLVLEDSVPIFDLQFHNICVYKEGRRKEA